MTAAPPMLPVAILAGGLATRLRPLTERIPKSLIDVEGQPFIAHQLRLLKGQGVGRVVICAGHLGQMIEQYVGSGAGFGLHVAYSYDGDRLLGTGGALRRAIPLLGDAFFVLYGDSYLPCDWRAVQQAFSASGRPALMTVYHNRGQFDRSNIEFTAGQIRIYSKAQSTPAMRHIDYGLGVFRRQAFDALPPDQPYDLAQLYQDLLARRQLAAFEVPNRFYEIGSLSGLEETKAYLRGLTQSAYNGTQTMSFSQQFLDETVQVIAKLDRDVIEKAAQVLADIRQRGGRLFILGVGGSAANASHAVNDFRKIAGLECYAPTDNVSELTARTNDEGWATVFDRWLRTSRLNAKDGLLIFSVGGGNLEANVSPNLVAALQLAKSVGAAVVGIVGRDGGYTAKVADACIIVPTVNAAHVTPHTEAFHAVVWHLLVSHPKLKIEQTKWESVK